jgi:hypothetical protein
MFVKVPVGGQVRPVTVWEDADANQPITGLVYFARPGKLYLPWITTLPREGIKAEPAALEELKNNPSFFADRYQGVHSRVLRGKAPPKLLESVVGKEIVVGQKLLGFHLGSLATMEVITPPSNGTVKVAMHWQRRKTESDKALAALYIDPEPPATATASTNPAKKPARIGSGHGPMPRANSKSKPAWSKSTTAPLRCVAETAKRSRSRCPD